jgi:guanylate cyclase
LLRASLIRAISLGSDPSDSEEDRLRKFLLVGGAYLLLAAAFAWGILYLYFDEPLTSLIDLAYIIITALFLIHLHRTHSYSWLRASQMIAGLLAPFLFTIALGGFVGSSAVILWSLITPMGALLLYDLRRAMLWWVAYLGTIGIAGLVDPYVRAANNLPDSLITGIFVLNLMAVSTIVILFLRYFLDQKDRVYRLLRAEEEKAENLLLNILPREIAAILKNEQRTIADQYEGASILFADLVGFTPLTAEMAPVEMVELLNEIFSHFDSLVENYDLEKIRTIGDNYMVASGVPRSRPDHAEALARLALDMRAYLESRPSRNGRKIEFRIGINSGPVIGGVIGRKKFVFDLWGDAVNIASRMESHSMPGKIQVTQTTYDLIADKFQFEPRGLTAVKGKGEMQTWFLVGEKWIRPVEKMETSW